MIRVSSLVLAVVAVAIGWFVLQRAQSGGWKDLSFPGPLGTRGMQVPPARGNETIRIATFNMQIFGAATLNDSETIQSVVSPSQNFTLFAMQNIRAASQD